LYELNLLNLTFRKLDLPKHGLINFGYHDKDSVYINYTSLTTPQKIYSYEIDTKSLKIVHEVELKNKNEYVLSQKWLVREKDSIPLILFHKKGLELNGNNPLLLYGYGGFGLSIIPYYEPYIHNFVDNEGIYAVAGIRGGGEMGKEWHDKGKAMNKKESFHDFKFCLEQMVQEKYTTPKKIAIMGYSNGGLIMNNALINYPHLFNTAISINGLSDIVNYPKYDNRGYSPEYFTSNRLKSYFYIKDYSPLQNVERIENNVLVVAGDKDDRVNPLHSYKFVKALQEQNSPNVFLYNIKNAGHGTLNVKKYHEVQREIFSFILNCCS
jgi:prolyl oligopeptidase